MISLTSPVETRAHHWSAGLKLALLCAATLVLFAVKSLPFHMAAFTACLILYALPGAVFFKAGLRTLLRLWPFLLLLMVWHILVGDGAAGLLIALRLLTAVGLAMLVTMTTRLTDMMAVVRFLLRPLARFGLNTALFELGAALVIRFTPTLAQKGGQLQEAWRARASSRPHWRLMLPFAVLAIDDAEHVADAIRARGGVARLPHSSM